MSRLRISLDDWHEDAQHEDPTAEAYEDMKNAAEYVFVALQKEGEGRVSTYLDEVGAMQNHPVLVAATAIVIALSRHGHSNRTLKIEELRLLENIANALCPIPRPTVAQDVESISAVSGGIAAKCACRIDPIGTGLAHDWLQAWLADHPGHIRREHNFVADVFRWLEGRSNGGRA